MSLIYGVDTDGEVTASEVRDAIVACFEEAHCSQTGVDDGGTVMSKLYCKNLVEKGFNETGGDFSKPTKESIVAVIGWLAEFSLEFRSKEMVEKHMSEIQQLVNLIKN